MDSAEFVDPYLDPKTGILHNLVGATDASMLAEAEADLVYPRIIAISHHHPHPSGDLTEFQEIHRYLFSSLYSWAGDIRTVDIRKSTGAGEFFLPVSMIERAFVFAAQEMRNDNMLKGLSLRDFVVRIAFHYDQINYIHPFREGNGRVQRIFFNRIAQEAGWRLDWALVEGSVNDEACRIAAEKRDLSLLEAMFTQISKRNVAQ